MKYSELFHTIQGEGQLIGVPSVFFRTSLLQPALCLVRHALHFVEAGKQGHYRCGERRSDCAVQVQTRRHHWW